VCDLCIDHCETNPTSCSPGPLVVQHVVILLLSQFSPQTIQHPVSCRTGPRGGGGVYYGSI
jgi:hypothetical protein